MPSLSLFARTFSPVPYVYLHIKDAIHYLEDTTSLREHCWKLLMPTPVTCEIRSLRHSRIVVVVFYDGVEKLLAQYIHKNNSERIVSKKTMI